MIQLQNKVVIILHHHSTDHPTVFKLFEYGVFKVRMLSL